VYGEFFRLFVESVFTSYIAQIQTLIKISNKVLQPLDLNIGSFYEISGIHMGGRNPYCWLTRLGPFQAPFYVGARGTVAPTWSLPIDVGHSSSMQ